MELELRYMTQTDLVQELDRQVTVANSTIEQLSKRVLALERRVTALADVAFGGPSDPEVC